MPTSKRHRPLTVTDCLGRASVLLPAVLPRADRCIATVVSSGFEPWLDDLLGSVLANGGCPDALIVVFAVDPTPEARRVAARHGALLLPCFPRVHVNATLKSLLYSVARILDASWFLCLDADMLVLGDLDPLFAALQACPPGSILAAREANCRRAHPDLAHALCGVYAGQLADLARLLGQSNGEASYRLVVNDGTFAGGRSALLALDDLLSRWTEAPTWVDEKPPVSWRNQFVFNLALAHLDCGVELDPVFNVQLNSQEVALAWEGGRIQARWKDRAVRILHFNGLGRNKYPEWRGLFARVRETLPGPGGGDGFGRFLATLRGWVGRFGIDCLAWSFYGTSDARSARVPDPHTFPLLALLHYLIRSNGCIRVLETGTGRGVSTACLASAVAHRHGARVVTFDTCVLPERDDLWAALPRGMRRCIEARTIDSLEGLNQAAAVGERYDAALLDSLHTEEQVWAEFDLAVQLVCPGGLILIHDACLLGATVAHALDRIAAAGYGVTRLWNAESGVAEGDHLGLAVIENRRRRGGHTEEKKAECRLPGAD